MTLNNIVKNFPEKYEPRDAQADVLKQIEDAINDGNKFIIIQSPTGTGKSMFSSTIANSMPEPSQTYTQLVDDFKIFDKDKYGEFIHEDTAMSQPPFGALVLTITKSLQNQYKTLFDNVDMLKGKSNYECGIDDEYNADLAPCAVSPKLYRTCQVDGVCDHLNNRNKLIKSKFGVINYSMFLSLPNHVKQRSVIVCDEASELEDELVGFFSVNIDYKRLSFLDIKKLTTDKQSAAHLWLNDVSSKLNGYVKTQTDLMASKSLKNTPTSLFYKLKNLKNLLEKINHVIRNWNTCEYVIEIDGQGATFVPLYVDTLSDKVFKYADTVILMSATIIDHKTFAKTLGIKDYKYIEVESSFDPNKSPIYCPGKYKLNYKSIDINLPKVVDQAVTICDHYNNKKGIIHTHNFKITEGIKRKAKGNRYLFREAHITNEHILEEHVLRKDGTVLVSPSLSHGTDLVGEFGEFQIIMKMPYLPLGSKRVKMLFEQDKDWYQMKMLINLVQMCGRCTRNVNDSSETFIMDGQAVATFKSNWNKLPIEFKARLK